jgi:dolichol-phosphate mannosyltransferase
VLIAALNEEQGIGPTLSDFKNYVQESSLLVVDGDSCDRTVEIAKNLGAEIVFQRGKGKGDAIAQAVQRMDFDGEYVIMTDADFTYPAEFVPKMIRVLEGNPNVGMVCGNRFNRDFNNAGMRNMFYAGNRFLAATHNFFNGVKLADPFTGLRVIRWSLLKGWKPKSTGFDIEVELNHHIERRGYGIVEIPISYRDRLGEKKLKARHGLEIFKRILLESTY